MTAKSKATTSIISLPRGGGAVGGMGETFTPDPFRGTGNFSVPIGVSAGRDGFSPQLSLVYSTGNGNGLFGMGWQLAVPEVLRSSRKGLPRYTGEDTFMFSGEDLVRDTGLSPVICGDYSVIRYRPRKEGMFARIEHWQNQNSYGASTGLSGSFWKVTTSDNITSIFGATSQAVVAQPELKAHIFRWCLELVYDGKGNYVKYIYKPEDKSRITPESERPETPSNRYLKQISYGNLTALPSRDASVLAGYLAGERLGSDCLFKVVLDYGEHGSLENGEELITLDMSVATREWDLRADAFSTHLPGFEVRVNRLCKRILMIHEFPQDQPLLVRSYDFAYQAFKHNGVVSLTRLIQRGYRKSETQTLKLSEESGLGKRGVRSYLYEIASMPPIEFEYSVFEAASPGQLVTFKGAGPSQPVGLHDPDCTLIDLFGRGMTDILETRRDGYRYWQNLGQGHFSEMRRLHAAPQNAILSQEGVGLADISGEGYPDILEFLGNRWGFYPGRMEGGWGPFQAFPSQPDFSLRDPNITLMDLTGDGTFDALRTDHEDFIAYECAGAKGFSNGRRIPRVHDLRIFPDVNFSDPRVHVADMTGDGLADIVMIENEKVHYWPNLGYGRFGPRVTTQVPGLRFEPEQMSFIDIDGSGPADLVQVESGRVSFWINHSGNGWSARHEILGTPAVISPESVKIADMLGTGTAGVLWSSPAGFEAYSYLPLTAGGKPGLLTRVSNNLGLTTQFSYRPSTELELRSESQGKPWTGRLPFPVWVLSRIEKVDHITGSKLITTYEYADGHYDEVNREFIGFGRVDQRDAESIKSDSHGIPIRGQLDQPPVLTRLWYHTGSHPALETVSRHFASEYYSQDRAAPFLPDSLVPPGLSPEEQHDALRALRGRLLRQEIYGEDNSELKDHPYMVSEHSYNVRLIQAAATGNRAVFSAREAESLDLHYERHPDDPRMAHKIVLEVDEFDHVTTSASVAYPRRPVPNREVEQSKMLISATFQQYAKKTDDINGYRHGVPIDERTCEITGIPAPDGCLLGVENLRNWIQNAAAINYEDQPVDGEIQKRLIEWIRYIYWNDQATAMLPAGQAGLLALPHNAYQAAFTPGLLQRVFGDRLDARILESEGGYVFESGIWWKPSGHPLMGSQVFDSSRFYRPVRTCDPFGNVTTIVYDPYVLLVEEMRDPLGNVVKAENDYRVLLPGQITDANGNRQAVAFDALGTVAGTAVMGKERERLGDSLDGFIPDLAREMLLQHIAEPLNNSEKILGKATSRILYDPWQYYRTKERAQCDERGQPIVICTLTRETHDSDLRPGTQSIIMHNFLYQDGFGRSIQTKVQAEPGSALPATPRWVGTGRTIYNNKGKPVKKYEPFFSATHRFETESEIGTQGVTPVLFYDALGRLVATLNPNHTYEKAVLDSWQQASWDVNDTLKLEPQTDPDIIRFLANLPEADYQPTWYNRNSLSADLLERNAASRTEPHAGTPTLTRFDALGRTFLTVAHNRVRDDSGMWRDEKYTTFTKLDAEGQTLWIRDARGNLVMQYISPPVASNHAADPVSGFVPCYDLAGNLLFQYSMDAGDRWMIKDAADRLFYDWEINERITDAGDTVIEHKKYHTTYDALHRPLANNLSIEGGDLLVIERFVYGESMPDSSARNLCGQVAHHYDTGGRITNEKFDFKGNLLEERRRLARAYAAPVIDWREDFSDAGLEDETFTRITEYDAFNRMARLWDWHRSEAYVTVHEPHYNRRGLLESGILKVGAARQPDGTCTGGQPTEVVREIGYDAKGLRERMVLGNGTETRYEYERETFRLKRVVTTRNADGARLQDLQYTYDPVSNITEISDDAQGAAYFANAVVDPNCSYEYDALYRLILATGREHAVQNNLQRDNRAFHPGSGIPFPNSPEAVQNYTERYAYDAVGNILSIAHRGGGAESWKRCYQYALNSNRVLATGRPGDLGSGGDTCGPHYVQSPTLSTRYQYDSNGNMLALDRSGEKYALRWDYRDMIRHINLGGGGLAWYNYDAGKHRTRKRIMRLGGAVEERLYLGGIELYRRWSATGELKEEIETHHLMVSEQRLLLIDDVQTTDNNTLGTGVLYRYQYGNQLGSAAAELDGDARHISYEEYHPYGSTAFSSLGAGVRATAKRYRYSGMEQDEETGLNYHTARYYLPWLARWFNPDPSGVKSGANIYSYCFCNPVRFGDANGKDPLDKLIEGAVVGIVSIPFLGTPLLAWGASQVAEPLADALHMPEVDRDAAVLALSEMPPIALEMGALRAIGAEVRAIRGEVQAIRAGVRVTQAEVQVARAEVRAVQAEVPAAQAEVRAVTQAARAEVRAIAQAARTGVQAPNQAAQVGEDLGVRWQRASVRAMRLDGRMHNLLTRAGVELIPTRTVYAQTTPEMIEKAGVPLNNELYGRWRGAWQEVEQIDLEAEQLSQRPTLSVPRLRPTAPSSPSQPPPGPAFSHATPLGFRDTLPIRDTIPDIPLPVTRPGSLPPSRSR